MIGSPNNKYNAGQIVQSKYRMVTLNAILIYLNKLFISQNKFLFNIETIAYISSHIKLLTASIILKRYSAYKLRNEKTKVVV